MDREILYRGKRIDTGEWVEGYYAILPTDEGEPEHVIIETFDEGDVLYHFPPVDPATRSQYTGLKDRNGKRIFEGDIVDVACSGDETWRCVVSDIRNIPAEMCGSHVKSMEVIGNIHDNPELLKEEPNNGTAD